MKVTILTSVAIYAAVASAQQTTYNVKSALSSFFPSATLSLNGAQSTSLASALISQESTWQDSPAFTSAASAIYSAAPSSVKSSIASSGYYYEDIVTQAWYTKSVPNAVQTAVAAEISAFDSVAEKFIGTPSSSKGGAKETGVPVALGAMVMGVAALL